MDNEENIYNKVGKRFCIHTPDAEFHYANRSGCYYENMSTKAMAFHAWTDTEMEIIKNGYCDMHNGD